MPKWSTLVVVGVMLAASCGSSVSPRPSVASLAAKLNEAGVRCEGVKMEPDAMIGRERGTCTSGADLLTLDAFDTNHARDAVFTGSESDAIVVLGDRWGVTVESVAVARRVQKALGGKFT